MATLRLLFSIAAVVRFLTRTRSDRCACQMSWLLFYYSWWQNCPTRLGNLTLKLPELRLPTGYMAVACAGVVGVLVDTGGGHQCAFCGSVHLDTHKHNVENVWRRLLRKPAQQFFNGHGRCSPDSDSYGVLTSNNELAMRVFETGCSSWVPMPGGGAGCGAGAECCELAVRVVETGCRLRAWWKQGAGAGCWCLAVRVAGTRCQCWACAWWKQGVWKAGGAGQLSFGTNMVAHALIPKLWMWLMELCVNIRMP